MHVNVLHASLYPELALARPTTHEWAERPYGVQMDLTYPNSVEDRHHFVFPIINRVQVVPAGQEPFQFMQWVTSIDDTRCVSYPVWVSELKEGPFGLQTGKFQPTTRGEIKCIDDGWWNIWERDQDGAAVDSQGVVANRVRENLGGSDRGITMLRKMIRDAITASERSEDPRGVLRDDDHEMIDLYAYKTELGAVAGQVRALEVGKKLGIVEPFDL
jgi:hypothetical protein